jgi:hypothetical protein
MIRSPRAMLIVAGMQALITAGVGLLVGVGAGMAAILFADAIPERTAIIGLFYWSLVLLMPLGVWLGHDIRPYGPYGRNGELAYASLPSALLTSGLGAVVGALLGAGLLFLAAPINMPVVLTGEDATTYSVAVRAALSPIQLALIMSATLITALLLGFISHYQLHNYG